MANVTTSFASLAAIEAAYAPIRSAYSLEAALSWAQAAFDRANDLETTSYSTLTSTLVSGTLSNGDRYTAYGSNLLSFPHTVTRLDYRFVNSGVNVSEYGSVSEAADGARLTGFINKAEVSSATYGKVTILGNANVAVFGAIAINSATWDKSGAQLAATGAVSATIDASYAVTLTGNYTSITLSYSGQTIRVTGISVAADAVFASAGDFLASVLAGADVISGTPASETLAGFAGNDSLSGGAGDDTLDGGGGADSMAGNAGNDIYLVNAVGDIVSENAGEGSDLVGSEISHTLAANVENLVLVGTANLNAAGNALDNLLIGNAGNNVLDGMGGNDAMAGGAGDDGYVVNALGDSVSENAAAGNDLVKSYVRYTLGANVENLTLLGTANLSGVGNDLANVLSGNVGNNVLNGMAGNDTLRGGLGDDTYVVNAPGDAVSEGLAAGNDLVQTYIRYTLGANVEKLTLLGTANLSGTGNALNNVLTGNSGQNVLNGLGGSDTMLGGAGNDTYVVGNPGDVVSESGPLADVDAVLSTISYTLGANLENLSLLGAEFLSGTGNALNNVLLGNSGANTLKGGAGNDRLVGGGGAGSVGDELIGGLGADVFVFNKVGDSPEDPQGQIKVDGMHDVIVDFARAQGDRIDLRGIDANTLLAGDQAFSFIGSADFTAAGQLRFDATLHQLQANVNAGLYDEFVVDLPGVGAMTASDFLL